MMKRRFNVEHTTDESLMADYLLTLLHDARATTLRYVQGITQEELDWQPYAGWNTVGALLAHIIACDYYFTAYFIERREFTEQENKQWLPALDLGEHVEQLKGKAPEYYFAELEKSHGVITAAVRELSNGQMLERRYDTYDKEDGSDLAWTLYHKAEDEIHHRGQISIVRKLYKQTGGKIA